MATHQDKILEKMRLSSYGELNFDFAFSLTNESERGAVLVGTSKFEVFIEGLLLIILPEHSKSYQSRLLQYPGALSSLSGKIELLYAFRIIDKILYTSLNALRKIRNKAAHDAENFTLDSVWQQMLMVFNFEPNFSGVIESISYDDLIKFKLRQIRDAFENSDLKDYDYQKIWDERYRDPKQDPIIMQQYRVWQMSYAMTFLCLKIEVIGDEYRVLNKTKNY